MLVKCSTVALTENQRKFVEYYCGNAANAVISAGYNVKSRQNAAVIGNVLMKKPEIIEAIKERDLKQQMKMNGTVKVPGTYKIATRADRQEWWTKIMYDEDVDMQYRIKASELLGKTEGDFLERVEHSGAVVTLEALVLAAVRKEPDVIEGHAEEAKQLEAGAEEADIVPSEPETNGTLTPEQFAEAIRGA